MSVTDMRQRRADWFLRASPFLGLILGAGLFAAGGLIGGLIAPGLDRWDRATVVRVCHDGTKVFRMEDGEFRVRGPSSLRSFHADGAEVCAP